MTRIIFLIITILFFLGCSNQTMDITNCINLEIKKADCLGIDKQLKEIGFKYAKRFTTFLIYETRMLNNTFFIECHENNKSFFDYILFRIKDKINDQYVIDTLIPYLVEQYGNFEDTDFDVTKISSFWNEGTLKAKTWELEDRRIYLLENFFDKSINLNLDLMYIEIK